jgi:flagellar hook assembly protein FlgD
MFNLAQNYPNPFNPVTTIKYTVPGRYSRGKKQFVMLRVYDIRGRLVKNLVNERRRPKQYQVRWDGKANNGRYIASGMYIYRIQVGDKWMRSRKMVIVK